MWKFSSRHLSDLANLITIITGIIATVPVVFAVFNWIEGPRLPLAVLLKSPTLHLVIALAVGVFTGLYVFRRLLSNFSSANLPLIISLGITIAISIAINWFAVSLIQEQRTVYFIVDASEHVSGLSDEVAALTKLNTIRMPRQLDLALAVYGGSIGGVQNCEDVTEIVPPSPHSDSSPAIYESMDLLSAISPKGVGSIQDASEHVLNDLAGRKGLQELLVITGGLDERCKPLNKEALNDIALKHDIRYTVIVVPVQEISEREKESIGEFAGQGYIELKQKTDLAELIEDVISSPRSFYYYGYQEWSKDVQTTN